MFFHPKSNTSKKRISKVGVSDWRNDVIELSRNKEAHPSKQLEDILFHSSSNRKMQQPLVKKSIDSKTIRIRQELSRESKVTYCDFQINIAAHITAKLCQTNINLSASKLKNHLALVEPLHKRKVIEDSDHYLLHSSSQTLILRH